MISDNNKLLFDFKKMQVGCVLLQACYGGDSTLPHEFDLNHWFLAPTENMTMINLNDKDLKILIEITNIFHTQGKEAAKLKLKELYD